MHHIWSIPELASRIVSLIDISDKEGQKAVAGLAWTARLFFEPAIQALWADVPVHRLARLLEALQNESKDERLARFTLYERWICSIDLSIAEDSDWAAPNSNDLLHTLGDLVHRLQSDPGVVFPRLASLTINIQPLDDEDAYGFLHNLGALCLVPSLRELHYTCQKDEPFEDHGEYSQLVDEMTVFFPALGETCRKLRLFDLKLCSGEEVQDFDIVQEVVELAADLFYPLEELETVKLPIWGILPEVLHPLSAIEHLKELVLEDTQDKHPSFRDEEEPRPSAQSSGWFPALLKLDFTGDVRLLRRILPDPGVTGITQLPMVEKLVITGCSSDDDEDAKMDITRFIRQLKLSPRIKSLKIDAAVEEGMTDEDIQLLATSWPGIEVLSLWLHRGYPESFTSLTARSLLILATDCKSLRYLMITLSSMENDNVPDGFQPGMVGIVLDVDVSYRDIAEYNKDAGEKVDLLVHKLWPAYDQFRVNVEIKK